MIHAYHVIFGAYGFWLPNDPRGSWSDFVGRWELLRFGRTTKSIKRLTLWACAVLPEHVHAVVARHRFKVEYIAGLLKGEATKQLKRDGLHPLTAHADSDTVPTPWGERCWKVFLDSDDEIERAIQYVKDNPLKEGKPGQKWSFVTPFAGIETSGWITYH